MLLCEIFMENLENELEETDTFRIFWINYVDDELAIITREETGAILVKSTRHTEILNSLWRSKERYLSWI